MDVSNVIIRKPITKEQQTIGIAMCLQLYQHIGRINELAEKLDLKTVRPSEILECLSIFDYYDRCATTLGFRNSQDMTHFIAIYGIDSLWGE